MSAPRPSALSSKAGWGRLLELKRRREPHLHQIEPTNACPYTCSMCIRTSKMKRKIGFMDMDLFRKVMAEVAGYPQEIREQEIELFHFGESLLHPKLPEMVACASGLGLRAVLSVNPPHLHPDLGEALLRAKPDRIICSLDGDDAESYRRMRGPVADFDKALANLERLMEHHRRLDSKVAVEVRMIRTRLNQDQEEAFVSRWRRAGMQVEIRPFFPWNEPALAELGEFTRLQPHQPCPFLWRYLVVQWNGDVVPCCRDCDADIVLGNVASETLVEIWNGPAYQDFREQMLAGSYRNPICGPCMQLYSAEPEG